MKLADAPFWTPAMAELDLLVAEFVRVYWLHRERCQACVPGQPWCPPLQDAWAAVEEFRDGRIRRSRAVYLRARQDFQDWAVA